MGLGVLVSRFTAVLATQAIRGTMRKSRMISNPSALGAGGEKGERFRLDYMGYSKYFFSASGVILLVCALALGSKGINFGIDFESGTRINVALTKNVDETAVRSVLTANGQGDAKVQKVKSNNKNAKNQGASAFQISTASLTPPQQEKITNAPQEQFGVAHTSHTCTLGHTVG